MDKVRLGRTNLHVGEIGIGCWAIGGPFNNMELAGGWDITDNTEEQQALIEALKLGANLFDSADVYGFGKSERELGLMLKHVEKESLAQREDIIIATKVGYFKGCAEHPYTPLHIRHQLEMSLNNLSTEYIDIYWFHHLDFGENHNLLEPALIQMRRFKDEGRVKYIGLRGPHKYSPLRAKGSKTTSESLKDFFYIADIVDPDIISLRYNVLSHKFDKSEADLFDWATKRDIGIITYKALAQGLLLDKYDPNNPPVFSSNDHRSRKAWFGSKGLSVLKSRLAIVKKEFNCNSTAELVQLFIKYNLSRSTNVCAVVGFRNLCQIRESLSTKGRLDRDQCQMLREIFEGISEEIGDFITIRKTT